MGGIFSYPKKRHQRRHGPRGYGEYASYRPWLRDEFQFRCVYCLRRETWMAESEFDLDHVTPQTDLPGAANEYTNLAYACHRCNLAKGDSRLPDPWRTAYGIHIGVNEDGSIVELTKAGHRLVQVLGLDQPDLNTLRARLLGVLGFLSSRAEGSDLMRKWLAFPANLPDLARLRPPLGNSRPRGVRQSAFERRRRGELPDIY